jgi:hypothetical protein
MEHRDAELPGFASGSLFTAATRPLPGSATAFHLDGDRFGTMHDLVELAISEQVLEARTHQAVPTGSRVSLGFEAHGTPARQGEVVTCDPCGDGFRVGIRLATAA